MLLLRLNIRTCAAFVWHSSRLQTYYKSYPFLFYFVQVCNTNRNMSVALCICRLCWACQSRIRYHGISDFSFVSAWLCSVQRKRSLGRGRLDFVHPGMHLRCTHSTSSAAGYQASGVAPQQTPGGMRWILIRGCMRRTSVTLEIWDVL